MTDELKAVLHQVSSSRKRSRGAMSRPAPEKSPDDAAQPSSTRINPITASLFGQELYARGWSMAEAAKRWGYSPSYLYRLARDKTKSPIWEDAARGIPPHTQARQATPDRERHQVVAEYINSIRKNSTTQTLRVHLFDTTGDLALPGADTYDPASDPEQGLLPMALGDIGAQHQIEHFVSLLQRWAGGMRKQDAFSYTEIIGACHQLYLERSRSQDFAHPAPFGMTHLLTMLKQSILDDELFAHRQQAALIGQQLGTHNDVYASAPQLLPASSKSQIDALRRAASKMQQSALSYAELLADVPSQGGPLRATPLERRISLAKLLVQMMDTGLFRSAPIALNPRAAIWRYDICKLNERKQMLFTIFRVGELFSSDEAEIDEAPLILLNDMPIPAGSRHKTVQKRIDQFFQ